MIAAAADAKRMISLHRPAFGEAKRESRRGRHRPPQAYRPPQRWARAVWRMVPWSVHQQPRSPAVTATKPPCQLPRSAVALSGSAPSVSARAPPSEATTWLASGTSRSSVSRAATSASRMPGMPRSRAALKRKRGGGRPADIGEDRAELREVGDRGWRLGEGRIVLRHDDPLAGGVHEDGREAGACALDAADVACVDAGGGDVGDEPVADRIHAGRRPERRPAAQRDDARRLRRGHALGDFDASRSAGTFPVPRAGGRAGRSCRRSAPRRREWVLSPLTPRAAPR